MGTADRLRRGVKPRGQDSCGCSGQLRQEECSPTAACTSMVFGTQAVLDKCLSAGQMRLQGDPVTEKQTWPSFALAEDTQGQIRAEGSQAGGWKALQAGFKGTLRIRTWAGQQVAEGWPAAARSVRSVQEAVLEAYEQKACLLLPGADGLTGSGTDCPVPPPPCSLCSLHRYFLRHIGMLPG